MQTLKNCRDVLDQGAKMHIIDWPHKAINIQICPLSYLVNLYRYFIAQEALESGIDLTVLL